jgi:UDP-N-acetylglucosamine 2-epimerase (non-hydrolysing)
VDDPAIFGRILDALEEIQRDMPVLFPIHPRTRRNLELSGLGARVLAMRQLRLVEPMGYLDFLKLMAAALIVLTDSGGIQEETTILQVPCLTLRENTERPVTCQMGTNQLVGTRTDAILTAYRRAMTGRDTMSAQIPPLWDGKAAERIAEKLASWS